MFEKKRNLHQLACFQHVFSYSFDCIVIYGHFDNKSLANFLLCNSSTCLLHLIRCVHAVQESCCFWFPSSALLKLAKFLSEGMFGFQVPPCLIWHHVHIRQLLLTDDTLRLRAADIRSLAEVIRKGDFKIIPDSFFSLFSGGLRSYCW